MEKPIPPFCLLGKHLLVYSFLCILASCSTFPKGVKAIRKGEIDKAEKYFKKSENHKTYGTGSKYYLNRIQINKDQRTSPWLGIHQNFCLLEKEYRNLSRKQILKLRKYDAYKNDVILSRANLKRRIVKKMSTTGVIPELLELEAKAACWSVGALDSLRRIVVNKTLDPSVAVFNTEEDRKWESSAPTLPTEAQVRQDTGYSCWPLMGDSPWPVSYDDVTTIDEMYGAMVMEENYSTFWKIKENIWDIFQLHRPYCDMEEFKADFPEDPISTDCWYDATQEVLCQKSLKPLLTFHRENPHTGFDEELCIQALCLLSSADDIDQLTQEEQDQLEDIRLMMDILKQIKDCQIQLDTQELILEIANLAEKYQYHRVPYELAKYTLDYFSTRSEYTVAREALETFQPLFPDSSVCIPGFYFQTRKQEWFNNYRRLLDRADREAKPPIPVLAWNTKAYDEYALVSWGETEEVFFMRRDRNTGQASLMTSRLKDKKWTRPTPVEKLSIADDVEPLSISSNGRLMLLKSNRVIFQSSRPEIGATWSKPEGMGMMRNFAGNAWLSPNDSLLIMEFYTNPAMATRLPKKDLAIAKKRPDGRFGSVMKLDSLVNYPQYTEGEPIMALGDRQFFYTSDNFEGLGEEDIYSAVLTKPGDWKSMEAPLNLGFPLNTIYSDQGLSYFSEYTGMAYFHRPEFCTDNLDIWQIKLGPTIFPENAMRLAGLVVDQYGKPIGGGKGFVEFTPDYQLNVHAQRISKIGTYTYTVKDSTEVVRLFPEVPGYYSERDTTHFLTNVGKGEIIRDTFILTSFDYIRRNFKLKYSTFFNKGAQFNNPDKAYPELTRLAKIATRMGAELELMGHTDNVGSELENLQLSRDRAEAVKQFLVKKCGFESRRIQVSGYGETRPICDNDTEEGRRCNRRVEVVFKMPDLPSKDKAISIRN